MHMSTDIGGTFTDFVVLKGGRLKTFKLLSIPKNPSLAVKQGLERFEGKKPDILSHGTTVATNAVLERKGARCALITTKGFSDILEIARQTRPSLYDFTQTRPKPYVERELCFDVNERVTAKGEILRPIDDDELAGLEVKLQENNVEAVAVSLLFSFLRPEHEKAVKEKLRKWPLSISSEVLPEFREYERTSTTVLDAYVKPVISSYITQLERDFEGRFYIMQSNGGVTTSNMAVARPINILLSGPAGGVAATKYIGDLTKKTDMISFDMGGTSADISIVTNGQPKWTSEGAIAGIPVRVPMLDITTIGAGGGSIVWLDSGGALRVGPHSAGAQPGPVCYGLGGKDITVTDCNLVAGYLGTDGLLGGNMPLALELARNRISELSRELGMGLEEFVLGVQKIVNSNMVLAVRKTLAHSGLDPRDFALTAFGGCGPMHACTLARELGIKQVIIPFMPGSFSAYGILVSDIRLNYSRGLLVPLEQAGEDITLGIKELRNMACMDLEKQGIDADEAAFFPSLDIRYRGQSYHINCELAPNIDETFHRKHEQLYGYAVSGEPLELVNIRMFAVYCRDKPVPIIGNEGKGEPKGKRRVVFDEGLVTAEIFSRENLTPGFSGEGPAVIEEHTATTVIPPEAAFTVDKLGLIHMEVA
jgi:N-methylhydantoinase A